MRRGTIAALGALIVGVTALVVWWRTKGASAVSLPAPRVDTRYDTTIQPLFDRRCVVCHSCFDSPCQLNLQSFEGLDRGANPKPVYEPDRLTAMPPTRMFQDAQTTAEWRARFGFFPVVARSESSAGDPAQSLLWRSVDQRRASPGGGPFDADKATTCPSTVDALDGELRAQPDRGMPYGFPALADEDERALAAWIRDGSGRGAGGTETDATRAEIARWETFFDATGPKERLVARYVYEHLFFAHLSLSSSPGAWYRLVRSRTKGPAPIEEIATVRPYDDPGKGEAYYRLRKITESIVEKTHVPYSLDDAKLAHLRALFLDADWGNASLAFPSYAPDVAANPFVAFKAIPARARYQFMLDDALYHVKTFIHGPVCKGQVALDVIDEHFLLFFLSPGVDPSVTHPDYLARFGPDLALPAEGGDGLEAFYERFKLRELAYLKERASFVRDAHLPGRTLGDVWDGDGTNRDAVLTVYRHFDSAYVMRGAVGGLPKTAWVLDYPIFERMYYDLVAGFDVFGNVVHQIATRRYMNLLRIEAENGLLDFLPVAQRAAVRAEWYRPSGVSAVVDVLEPSYAGPETQVVYQDPSHAKDELVTRLLTAGLPPAVVGSREPVQWSDVPIVGDSPSARFERAARTFVRSASPFVRVFPDTVLVRVDTGSADDAVYTIVRNKAHLNVDFMFLEGDERAVDEDTLHVVRGIVASRPNLLLKVKAADVDAFAADVRALAPGDASWAQFVARYGARRSDPGFWAAADFFNARFPNVDPFNAGILDLSRYVND